jgi:hypothetical protein
LRVAFVLPEGVTPARSNLPGVPRLGRWTATYFAAPLDGVRFTASFSGIDPARLRDVRVVVPEGGVPAGEGWQRLPAWLPLERMAWSLWSSWSIAPAFAPIEPVPPLPPPGGERR